VQLDSFREFYASKTDGELLSLAAEKDSLVEGARLALADELRRRTLGDPPELTPIAPPPAEVEPQPDRQIVNPSRFLWLGLFLLDTFLVYQCAWPVSRMLVRMWFAWFAPIFGTQQGVTPVDWHLRHLALVTVAISLVAGYIDLARFLPAVVGKQIAGRRSRSPATWVWIIPAAILLYDILQFRASSSSVFGPSTSVLGYFFGTDSLVGSWARMRAQMVVTAPFYAGVAYSLGALAWKHSLLPKLISFAKQD
jgi:hypothetical protein